MVFAVNIFMITRCLLLWRKVVGIIGFSPIQHKCIWDTMPDCLITFRICYCELFADRIPICWILQHLILLENCPNLGNSSGHYALAICTGVCYFLLQSLQTIIELVEFVCYIHGFVFLLYSFCKNGPPRRYCAYPARRRMIYSHSRVFSGIVRDYMEIWYILHHFLTALSDTLYFFPTWVIGISSINLFNSSFEGRIHFLRPLLWQFGQQYFWTCLDDVNDLSQCWQLWS